MRLDFSQPVRFEVAYNYWIRWAAVLLVGVILAALALLLRPAPQVQCRVRGSVNEDFLLGAGDQHQLKVRDVVFGKVIRRRMGGLLCAAGDQVEMVPGGRRVAVQNGSRVRFKRGAQEYEIQFTIEAAPRGGAGKRVY